MTDTSHLTSPAWRRILHERFAIATLGVVALALLGGAASSSFRTDAPLAKAIPPKAPEMATRPLAEDEARKINASIPLERTDLEAVSPFAMRGADKSAFANALQCLSEAIYYEAALEPSSGQRAVAQVVLNRARHPAFPSSICGVVYQGSTRQTGCQFTFTCDGSLARKPEPELWERARKVAREALSGHVHAAVGTSTHYHADYVLPYWSASLAKTAVDGTHIFYRWTGDWGRLPAFTQAYSGREADPARLRLAAMSVDRSRLASTVEPAKPAIEKVGGQLVRTEGKRLRVRFTPEAREAVEKVAEARKPYVEKVEASDNLRWALGGGEETQAPLGSKVPASD